MQYWTILLLLILGAAASRTQEYKNIELSREDNRQVGSNNGMDSIAIGLISDNNAEILRATFDYAIAAANTDISLQLIGYQEVINYGDALAGYAGLCQMMSRGVGAVFGPSSPLTSAHLNTICDSKDVPYGLHAHVAGDLQLDGLNLYPDALDMAGALNAIITHFEWNRFIFLYESSAHLQVLDGLMAMYETDGPVISVLRYDLHLNGNYKPVLRRVRKSIDSRIIIVGSTASVADLLKQAQQVGIINEDYKYIIANLDFHTFDLEEYKYSEVNITGFRLFSPEQREVRNLMTALNFYEYEERHDGTCPITMEMAITYDAVQVFAETTKYLQYQPQSLNCSDKHDDVQHHGSTFKNYMHSLDITEKTLTGRINFEGHVRKGYTLDVIELQPSGIVKVGTWNEENSFVADRPPLFELPNENNLENSLVNKTFKVLISVPNKPYANLVEAYTKLEGNSQFEGYCVDLIKELADKLGFNFTLINGGNDYGSFNKTTNITTGMLKEIVDGNADLAMTDLTITSEREEVIDFSIPFMNLGIAILYIKPTKTPPALFSFMDPFSGEVWLYLGLSYFGVSLSFFILGRLSPTEWDNPYPCIEPDELENQFTICSSLWFTTGALLQQGSEIAPKALSTRTIAAIWWFFTLIMVSSYTANLAAFLTIENPTGLIDNVYDLADNKGGVQFGAKRTGSTRNFFLTSEDEMYRKMNEYLNNNPEQLTETNQDGVDRVKSGKYYAFMMESTSIEYNIVRECNLMKIGDPLDEKGYGIAMIKNWPYRDKFNNALLELQEQGVLAQLKNKWWNEVGAGVCDAKSSNAAASPLGLDNLGGVYLVLVVGSALSIFYGIVKWIVNVFKKARRYKAPIGAAYMEELKTAVNFTNNELVLKSATSVYSRSRNSSMSIDSMDSDESTSDPEDEP